MMAFAVEDYVNGEVRHSSSFVKWFAGYTTIDADGEKLRREIPMAVCTEEDFAKFYVPEKRSLSRLK